MTTAGSWVWPWPLIAASSPTTSADSPCRKISARTSSTARSAPLMMNSVQYPQPMVGASMAFGRAGWVAGQPRPEAAGVDPARLLENGQLLGGAFDRFSRRLTGSSHHIGEIGARL